MKLEQASLLLTSFASLFLDANATGNSPLRKREGSLPESLITSADDNINVSSVTALKLSQEEELFLRFVESSSLLILSSASPSASPTAVVTTKAPKGGKALKGGKTPKASKTPGTKAPKATKAPKGTKAPKATKAPKGTKAPN